MASIDYNITTFNGFAILQMDALNARGETSSDILINLFKGYLAAPNKEFNMYIKQMKNEYKEGQDLSEDDIMVMAGTNTRCL